MSPFRAFGKLAREKIRMFPQPGRSQKLVFHTNLLAKDFTPLKFLLEKDFFCPGWGSAEISAQLYSA